VTDWQQTTKANNDKSMHIIWLGEQKHVTINSSTWDLFKELFVEYLFFLFNGSTIIPLYFLIIILHIYGVLNYQTKSCKEYCMILFLATGSMTGTGTGTHMTGGTGSGSQGGIVGHSTGNKLIYQQIAHFLFDLCRL
jgi:hypothetical protein